MNIDAIISNHLERDAPHSEAFKIGMKAGMLGAHKRVDSVCPYKSGTDACDAYHFGHRRGIELYEQAKQMMRVY